MRLSRSEQATLNFYQWEIRGRGYIHYDAVVEVEPPYEPFTPFTNFRQKQIDDGRVPSFFKLATNLLFPAKHKEEIDTPEIVPKVLKHLSERICFSITFPLGTEISIHLMQEILNIVSFSEDSFSFEILSQHGKLIIQLTSSERDSRRLETNFKAFFPDIIVRRKYAKDINFNFNKKVAIADFGLDNEFMLPVNYSDSLAIDPLTSIIATLGNLQEDEVGIFQIIFNGVLAPWSSDMLKAVSDGSGGCFFVGYPEFVSETLEKIRYPLFGVVMRIGVQGITDERSQLVAQDLARTITTVSSSQYNRLIPLSNEGYNYEDHLKNIVNRTTNRIGFILNSNELAHFVHYPNKTVVSDKLGIHESKTKSPSISNKDGIHIGTNIHNGIETKVLLDIESRLSHTHILGTTGVGKSTLIAQMMLADIEIGRGCAIFDPHGDICDDILKRIPKSRIDDVALIDPSDSEFPIGFNLLEANTEAEAIVLSSDLVSAFKRHATAWGDNMTAVLQNAVNTILDSARGGTLIELKRFLIEEKFRSEYLSSVEDPSLHYYWQHEYPMVRKGIAPLLTRIDTFLRPKLVRYMLAQKSGVDIGACLENNKIVLLKLSQGLIGEQNSYLLGSLFLAKFNQAALARQTITRESRTPYMLYLDEFQNFITPSIESMLSGTRKYGLGITIVHQELGQIQDTSLLNSVLSNPKTRICFRLGDNDAKRLESGFSYFEQMDLQNLNRGEAIMRIGTSSNDFNLLTHQLSETEYENSDSIIARVRSKYGKPRKEVEAILLSMLPKISQIAKENPILKEKVDVDKTVEVATTVKEPSISEKIKKNLIREENKSTEIRAHVYLQSMIKKLGQDRNFIATIEYPTSDGGRIDIVLEREGVKVGFEVSETNKAEYEVKNIQKCLREGCLPVVVVSKSPSHLSKIQKLAKSTLSKKDINLVKFINPDEIAGLLNALMQPNDLGEETIKGFRVITEFEENDSDQTKNIKSRIAKLFKPKS